jgi:hypothetical protein
MTSKRSRSRCGRTSSRFKFLSLHAIALRVSVAFGQGAFTAVPRRMEIGSAKAWRSKVLLPPSQGAERSFRERVRRALGPQAPPLPRTGKLADVYSQTLPTTVNRSNPAGDPSNALMPSMVGGFRRGGVCVAGRRCAYVDSGTCGGVDVIAYLRDDRESVLGTTCIQGSKVIAFG